MGGVIATLLLAASSSFFVYERLTGRRKPGVGDDFEIGGTFIIFFPFSSICIAAIILSILGALDINENWVKFSSGLASILLGYFLTTALIGREN